MIVESITVGPFVENAFIAGCEDTREVFVIDPGAEAERILDIINTNSLKVLKIINTHAHIDHIGAVQEIRKATGAGFFLHKSEEPFVQSYDQQCKFFGVRFGEKPEIDGFLAEGDTLRVGKYEGKVVYTPGHSPGGLCFVFGDRVFAGDTLFMGSIGRTDLPGGDHNALIGNIKKKLLTLPPDMVVHCGHGPDTSIGREKERNPFLTGNMNIFGL